MTWTLALLSGLTAVPVGIWTGGSMFDKEKSRRRNRASEETQQIESTV
jgi:hypothetical protein